MAGGVGDDVDALMMNAPTQPLGDAEGSDDSPLSAMHGPAEAHPNALATALANEDSRARTEALRDAASAAAALRAARGEHEVVPLPEPNPYALAAPVSTPPPSLRKPKQKDDRFESPEKKAKVDQLGKARSTGRTGLEPPPLFGGGGGAPSSKSGAPLKQPEVYNLDPPQAALSAPPAWVHELRDMMTGGQRELLTELQDHKAHLSQVVHQVQGIDRKQEALSRAQGDMVTRLDNMEAEVRDLKARSRSVSPAPPYLPPPLHSPRSTTASTAGKPVVDDDLQLVIGGWDEARRTDIEHEVKHLFEQIDATALLHNIHIPFVRSRFARIELLYVGSTLSERRRVQTGDPSGPETTPRRVY